MNIETEANWDTEEMGRWIANDPALYNLIEDCRLMAKRITLRHVEPEPLSIEMIVRDWLVTDPHDEFTVDLDKVDWEAVT